MRIAYHVVSAPAPLGLMFLAATSRGICRAEFMDRRSLKRTLQSHAAEHPGAEWAHSVADLRPLAEQLDDWFCGVRERLDWPIDPVGTELETQVWAALRAVPFGQTCTLTQLARAVAQPQGSRAVAAAVLKNPIALAIPCHRVVGADGRPTAYVGGLPRKKWLLSLESRFHSLPHPDDNRVIAEARVVVRRPAGATRRKVARAKGTALVSPRPRAIAAARVAAAPAAKATRADSSSGSASASSKSRPAALIAKQARGKR